MTLCTHRPSGHFRDRLCSVRQLLILVGALLLLMFCPPPLNAQVRLEFSGKTMGPIDYSVILVVADADREREYRDAIVAALEHVNELMSTYLPESDVSRFNRSESIDWFPVDVETARVVRRANEISQQTDGAFDITVGPAVDLWNFGPKKKKFAVPSDDAIESVKAIVGYRHLESRLSPPSLKKNIPELNIDLSAIAKGYAVDRVVSDLTTLGVKRIMVSVGGEVRANGMSADDRPWRIGIEQPSERERKIAKVIELQSGAVATSGDYRNFSMVDGVRYSHTIDPRTCQPVKNLLATASVIAPDCMTADAMATAVMVLGSRRGSELSKELEFPLLTIRRGESDPFDESAFEVEVTGQYPILGRKDDGVAEEGAALATPKRERGILGVFIAAAVIFGLAVLGMAIGAIVANKPVQGSCGGLANMAGADGDMECGVCEKPATDCKERASDAGSAG